MNEINEWMVPRKPEDKPDDVILASLRLSRALRRCAPEQKSEPFPPAVGRLLTCVGKNSGVSSRELCELLDLRPSSLSEILSRGEAAGFMTRTADENDRRIQHISLSEKGREILGRIEMEREDAYRKRISCFTEEEARQFCELSSRLTAHLESFAADNPMPESISRHSRHPCGKCEFPPLPDQPENCPLPENRPDPGMPPPGQDDKPKRPPRFPDEARFKS